MRRPMTIHNHSGWMTLRIYRRGADTSANYGRCESWHASPRYVLHGRTGHRCGSRYRRGRDGRWTSRAVLRCAGYSAAMNDGGNKLWHSNPRDALNGRARRLHHGCTGRGRYGYRTTRATAARTADRARLPRT
jgi:hypothetical protein